MSALIKTTRTPDHLYRLTETTLAVKAMGTTNEEG